MSRKKLKTSYKTEPKCHNNNLVNKFVDWLIKNSENNFDLFFQLNRRFDHFVRRRKKTFATPWYFLSIFYEIFKSSKRTLNSATFIKNDNEGTI